MIDLSKAVEAFKHRKDLETPEPLCTTPGTYHSKSPAPRLADGNFWVANSSYLNSRMNLNHGSDAQTEVTGFWRIATSINTILHLIRARESDNIPMVSQCTEDYLSGVLKKLILWRNGPGNRNIEQVGRAFMKMAISMQIFLQYPKAKVRKLERSLSKIIQSTNIEQLAVILERVCTLETPKEFKGIPYILGACYLSGKMAPTLTLARRLGLGSINEITNVDWLAYCSNLHLEEQPDAQKASDLNALETSLKYRFHNKTLLQKVLWPDPAERTFRKLEWIGDCLLGLWSAERLAEMGTETQKKKGLGLAFIELNCNTTLAAWADRWLHPHKQLVKPKIGTGDKVCKASANMVECLVFVLFIDCGSVFGPESTFYQVLDRWFYNDKERNTVSQEHFTNVSDA
ncbi:uncharacterized protein MELLADRAFT_63275 [Melampsora larici-populina 98AG31]|uniref:RNase III domain-containing protein n=1 Tax=Melampsora larici-populina (strain 98AG31 / pathotype 3-4-7) TaxID=747676 RepID=F4RM23_MELLP|nr:uncharacterized protein MELLADRAFT_63275 [Melampsora larici-populina 98AG31]EGG06646.1 hypothetical protein MELLADRAFT_63275 [Melampsora larici-populina 98AG31]